MTVSEENGAAQDGSSAVVIHVENRIIKGYLELPAWNPLDDLLHTGAQKPPELFRIRNVDADKTEEIPTEDVIKAVFFVKDLTGYAKREKINFHKSNKIAEGIWMRLHFFDGEVMEGIAFNSINYLVDPGFFLLPTDPSSNNILAYVIKKAIRAHQVLGLRNL